MSQTLISFIIPHKGREQFLLATIDSVINQQYDLSQIEIIIVTQNESLSDSIYSLNKNIYLSVYTRPITETISSLRNFGVKNSRGKYLAFLDADIELSPNWISAMLETLNDTDNRVISSAVQKNSVAATPLEKIRTALSNASTDQNVNFLPGRNLFLTRETFDKLNGFPEHLITCEDYYFTDKATKIGDLYYTSAATYIHLGEDKDYNEMFKKEIWRGQSNLLSIKGRSIPLSEIPSFIIPIGLLFLLIITFIALIAGYKLIAALSFICFILPIAIYSTRLYLLCRNQVSFYYIAKFYLYYFPARAIGTIGGIFRTFNTSSHNS